MTIIYRFTMVLAKKDNKASVINEYPHTVKNLSSGIEFLIFIV